MLLEELFGFAQALLNEDRRSRLFGPATSVENAEQLIWHPLAPHELVGWEIQSNSQSNIIGVTIWATRPYRLDPVLSPLVFRLCSLADRPENS